MSHRMKKTALSARGYNVCKISGLLPIGDSVVKGGGVRKFLLSNNLTAECVRERSRTTYALLPRWELTRWNSRVLEHTT